MSIRRRRRGSSQYRNPLSVESRWKKPTWVRGSIRRLFWPWTTGLFQLSYNFLTGFFIQGGCVLYCWLSFLLSFFFPFLNLPYLANCCDSNECLFYHYASMSWTGLSLSDLNPVYKSNSFSHECRFINTVFIVYTLLVYVLWVWSSSTWQNVIRLHLDIAYQRTVATIEHVMYHMYIIQAYSRTDM